MSVDARTDPLLIDLQALNNGTVYVNASHFWNMSCLGPSRAEAVTFYLNQLMFDGLRVDSTMFTILSVTLLCVVAFLAEMPNDSTVLGKICYALWVFFTLCQVLLTNASTYLAVASEIAFAIRYDDCLFVNTSSKAICYVCGVGSSLLVIYFSQSLIGEHLVSIGENRHKKVSQLKMLVASLLILLSSIIAATTDIPHLWFFIFFSISVQPRIIASVLLLQLYWDVLSVALIKGLRDAGLSKKLSDTMMRLFASALLGPFRILLLMTAFVFVLSASLAFSLPLIAVVLFHCLWFNLCVILFGYAKPGIQLWWKRVRSFSVFLHEYIQYYIDVISSVSEDDVFTWVAVGNAVSPALVFGFLAALKLMCGQPFSYIKVLHFCFQTPYRFVMAFRFQDAATLLHIFQNYNIEWRSLSALEEYFYSLSLILTCTKMILSVFTMSMVYIIDRDHRFIRPNIPIAAEIVNDLHPEPDIIEKVDAVLVATNEGRLPYISWAGPTRGEVIEYDIRYRECEASEEPRHCYHVSLEDNTTDAPKAVGGIARLVQMAQVVNKTLQGHYELFKKEPTSTDGSADGGWVMHRVDAERGQLQMFAFASLKPQTWYEFAVLARNHGGPALSWTCLKAFSGDCFRLFPHCPVLAPRTPKRMENALAVYPSRNHQNHWVIRFADQSGVKPKHFPRAIKTLLILARPIKVNHTGKYQKKKHSPHIRSHAHASRGRTHSRNSNDEHEERKARGGHLHITMDNFKHVHDRQHSADSPGQQATYHGSQQHDREKEGQRHHIQRKHDHRHEHNQEHKSEDKHRRGAGGHKHMRGQHDSESQHKHKHKHKHGQHGHKHENPHKHGHRHDNGHVHGHSQGHVHEQREDRHEESHPDDGKVHLQMGDLREYQVSHVGGKVLV